jgi:hypothetical protein
MPGLWGAGNGGPRRRRVELGEDRFERVEPRREREFVALNDVVKLADQRYGFFVGEFKVLHGPRYGGRESAG